ncbi:MAG: hypothetical protein ACI9TH_000022 [Kiritimatiellia bacterium]|jgi:hypothetical protein
MNNYPQDPNNPYGNQPQDPNQPVYEYQQEYVEEPIYEEYVEEPPAKDLKRWLPHLIISGVTVLIAAGIGWHFRDSIKEAMGIKKEVAEVVDTSGVTNQVVEANNVTGEFIIEETSSLPVKMLPEWKERIEAGRNQHGIFYVPIDSIPKIGEGPVENLTSADLVVKSAGVRPMQKFGFEDSRGEWQNHGGGIIVTSQDEAHEGSSSLGITDRKSPSDYPQRDLSTTVKKGSIYRFTAYVKLKNKPEADIKLVVVQNGVDKILVKRTCAADKWTQLNGNYSCRPDGDLSSVYFTVQCLDPSVEYYIDSVGCAPSL